MRAAAGDVVVRTDGLRRSFGPKVAVDGIVLEVRRGEVFGLLGPNGAGKTTALRMLLGLLPPSGGSAEVLGWDPARQARALKERVGYVSQLHSLYGDLTVGENLSFFARAYGLDREQARAAVHEQVERFRLEESLEGRVDRQPTGVRRRAALAAALLHTPELLVLDEPTSGMDPGSRRRFWNFLGGLVGEGTTIIVTTHHLEEAEGCDRLAVMLDGTVRFTGVPEQLRNSYGDAVLEVDARPWTVAFSMLKSFFGASLAGRSVRVDPALADEDEVEEVLERSDVEVVSIVRRPPTLEDAFLKLAATSGASGDENGEAAADAGSA